MKSKTVGIFTDTHGNLLALNAILKLFEERGVTKLYHLGDIVSMGPRPVECMQKMLSNKNLTCILGNHDNDYYNDNTTPPEMSHVSAEHKKYIFSLLGQQFKESVGSFPILVVESFFGLKVAFMHYGLARPIDLQKNKRAVFRPIEEPTAASLDAMFEAVPADIVFFGHKHSPIDLTSQKVYCDVGSVGCHKGSFARGVIFTGYEDKSFKIERVQVPYDRTATFADMNQLKVPSAEYIQNFYFSAD